MVSLGFYHRRIDLLGQRIECAKFCPLSVVARHTEPGELVAVSALNTRSRQDVVKRVKENGLPSFGQILSLGTQSGRNDRVRLFGADQLGLRATIRKLELGYRRITAPQTKVKFAAMNRKALLGKAFFLCRQG